MARYRIGNDMTILWTVNDRDGKALPLRDKEVHLYYTCERGRFEAEFEIQGTSVVAWNFLGKNQRALGDYTLSLEILQSDGKRSIKKDMCKAFTLVGKECEENYDKDGANINEGGEVTIVSDLDIYRISPIIPYIGENENWWVDGEDTGDPSRGKSAYDYAKSKGYDGKEDEFASLQAMTPKLLSSIKDEIANIQQIVIQGNVTNAADEEDITSEGGLLKLKNRSTSLGMGYEVLRRNKPLAEQIIASKHNTIYEVRYDFDLLGATITMGSGCILYFNGGSIRNGSVDLAYSKLQGNVKLYTNISNIGNGELYLSWFTDKGGEEDVADELQMLIDNCGPGKIIHLDRQMFIGHTINMKSARTLRGRTDFNGTFLYPTNNFQGEVLFNFDGVNDSTWIFRSEISNIWINLQRCTSGELTTLFKVFYGYSILLSRIKVEQAQTNLNGLDVANCTGLKCADCRFYGRSTITPKGWYGIYAHGYVYDLNLDSVDVELYQRGIYITEQVNAQFRNIYTERCMTGVVIENLQAKGNVTIDGGIIAVPSADAYGMRIYNSQDCYINILGVDFHMPDGNTNGIYLENSNINKVNIVGIKPLLIKGANYSTDDLVNILSDMTFKNRKSYNNIVRIYHNKKQELARIYTQRNNENNCGIIRIDALYYMYNKSLHRVAKQFYFGKSGMTGVFEFKELSVPIIEHREVVNYNASFNIKSEYKTDSKGNYVSIYAESRIIGEKQSGNVNMSYYLECSSIFTDGFIVMPINESLGTDITTSSSSIEKSPSTGTARPSLTEYDKGHQFYDTSLNKPIWWTGSSWVDANGSGV